MTQPSKLAITPSSTSGSSDTETEIWKPVVGFPNYEVSHLARIRNATTHRVLKPVENSSGYLMVNLYSPADGRPPRLRLKAKLIHRLHYTAFIGPVPAGLTIDHLDFDKQGNRLNNYRLCTSSENAARSHAAGRHPKGPGTKPGAGYFGSRQPHHIVRGERTGAAKLTEQEVVEMRRRRAEGRESFGVIAKTYGVSSQIVGRICRRQQWAHVPDPPGKDWSPSTWLPTIRATETAPRKRRTTA